MAEPQLPETDVKTVADIVGILRRRKWNVVVPALAVFGLAALLAIFLPRMYKSTTTILIEEQEVPREYVATNITSFADQRLQTINQRIMSTTNLIEVMNRFHLYEDRKDRETIDEIVERMRKKDIKFATISADVIDPRSGRPAQATIAFSVSYEGKNPETVQQVASELASLYLQENLKTRERQSSETYKFMEDEMKDVQGQVAALDAKIAEYKQKHITSLPELAQLNQQAVDQVDRDLDRMQDQLRTLRERESYLEQQLAGIPPDTADREKENLKELHAQLVELKSRYSDEYPDVIKTKVAIRDLESRLKVSGRLVQGTKPDNPAYITLSSQLAGARSEIDSVKRQIKDLQAKRNTFRERIEAAPRVEEGYRTLMAERNNLQAKYDEMTRKSMDAKVAHGLEKEQLGERFTIVEAARLPEKPSSPNIPAILLIGLVLGLGSGVGFAAVKESSDTTVHSLEQLTSAVAFSALVAIPEIVTPKDIRRRKVRNGLLVGTSLAAIVLAVVLFHVYVMDLDVVWARLMRRLA
ncbi:MAG: Wzz/FepE/Etk N-terminal domain-containing protein [Candidatus Deferrimicrobium sp.]